MSADKAHELANHLKGVARDHLRSVIYFDGFDHDLVYVRDDVRTQYSDDNIESIIESLIADSLQKEQTEELYVHGPLDCVVRCFDNGLELLFPHGDLTGTAISFDPEAARDLDGLIVEVLRRMTVEDASPRDILSDDSG